MTAALAKLITEKQKLLADAKFHHEQGYFEGYTNCMNRVKEIDAELEAAKQKGTDVP